MKPKSKRTRGIYEYRPAYRAALKEVAEDYGMSESALVINAINKTYPEVLARAKQIKEENKNGDDTSTRS